MLLCSADFNQPLFFSISSTTLSIIAGDTVTINSSNFNTTDFDSFFNFTPPAVPPEDIRWFFQDFEDNTCIEFADGALGDTENVIMLSPDRQSVTIRNVQIPSGGGALFRVIPINGANFVQNLAAIVRCK